MDQIIKSPTKPVTMTASQICAQCDLSPVYVKRALQRGWLKGTKQLMPGTKVYQWVVARADVEAWRKSTQAHKTPKAQFIGSPRQVAELREFLKSGDAEAIAAVKAALAAAAK
jgi:hypothetical protein